MKPGTTSAIIIFVLVAVLHLYRVITGMPVMLGEWAAPMWISYLGVAVPLVLAYLLWTGK